MKIKHSPLAIALLGTIAASGTALAENSSAERYIIKYKNSSHAEMSNNVIKEGGKVKKNLAKHKMLAVELPEAAMKKFKQRGDVEYVELDAKRYLLAESQPYGIGMVQADQVNDALTGNMKVCITDTGYSLGHEDLPNSGVTGDDGYDTNDSGNWFEDGHGHGTHVAGTIAAIGNNDTGVVGVNPSGNLNLHIVKVFDSAGDWAYGSDMIGAVDQCVAAGANIISMSLGGSAPSAAEQTAFDNAAANNVLLIAAAGNDGNDTLSYPASYDSIMSVAAVDSSGRIAGFSQYNNKVEIAAPGVDVNSTLPNNSYAAWSGTSMATPHVAGVAALVWSHYSDCTAAEIRQAINKSAEDKGDTRRDIYYGHGIIKAKAMYDMLANGCDVGPIAPPPPLPELANGVPETNLSGEQAEDLKYVMNVPAGATNLTFTTSGGSGDAELKVSYGTAPTSVSADCSSINYGNDESCSFPTPQEGIYYVLVTGFSAFSGVELIGEYQMQGLIGLSLTTSTKKTTGIVNLTFSGASTNVDIFRNGSKIKSTAKDSYKDSIQNASGSYTYKVCEGNTDNCSIERTASF